MGNSVFAQQNYGEIMFSFDKIMEKKGINRYQLSNMAGIRFEVADRYYKGKIERVDVDVLARICFVLDCDVADVITYQIAPQPV
jgi:putative transcriptional regulator